LKGIFIMRQFFNIRAAALATVVVFSATPTFAGGDDHTPKFGGIVVQTKAVDIEIVAKPESIQLYITDRS
jgi:hypothetical protein